jgi:hypothetical protein
MASIGKRYLLKCIIIFLASVQSFRCDNYSHSVKLRIIWNVCVGKVIFWEVTVSVILSKKLYMYMCPIPNGFRDTAISLYSSKIVDKKEILHTVSNTGIYCSSDKVGTAYIL